MLGIYKWASLFFFLFFYIYIHTHSLISLPGKWAHCKVHVEKKGHTSLQRKSYSWNNHQEKKSERVQLKMWLLLQDNNDFLHFFCFISWRRYYGNDSIPKKQLSVPWLPIIIVVIYWTGAGLALFAQAGSESQPRSSLSHTVARQRCTDSSMIEMPLSTRMANHLVSSISCSLNAL